MPPRDTSSLVFQEKTIDRSAGLMEACCLYGLQGYCIVLQVKCQEDTRALEP